MQFVKILIWVFNICSNYGCQGSTLISGSSFCSCCWDFFFHHDFVELLSIEIILSISLQMLTYDLETTIRLLIGTQVPEVRLIKSLFLVCKITPLLTAPFLL